MRSTFAAPAPGHVHIGPDQALSRDRNPNRNREAYVSVQPLSAQGTVPDQKVPDNNSITEPEKGGMAKINLYSRARNKNTTYLAFVPPQSGNGQLFPVFYLLHGAWDGYQSWNEHAHRELCDLSRQHGLIIVTPDGDEFGWYADSTLDPANQIETYLIDELLPDVEKNLPANGRRGIGGLSMGGHGAFVLTMRHPVFFSP